MADATTTSRQRFGVVCVEVSSLDARVILFGTSPDITAPARWGKSLADTGNVVRLTTTCMGKKSK